MTDESTIHASAILVGPKAALIRGPAGSGKSLLTWNLLAAASQGFLPFARLVGDDRVHVDARSGRLLVTPKQSLTGLIEIRGLGIRRVPYEAAAVVGLAVDLAAADGARLPEPAAGRTILCGVTLPRLAVAAGMAPLPMVLAALDTRAAGD
ncbi:MAG TPA: serine kinase [Pseudolabrys sp.]|nr:serine kinase [Pseudolabrys sp.]